MRYLLAFLLFCAGSAWAATGDIISAAVETNGWVCRIEVELGTNVQFFNGFGTNNSLSSSNNLRLDLTSMGFDDAGNGIQVGRSVYGTKLLRMPYEDHASFDVRTNGGDLITSTLTITNETVQTSVLGFGSKIVRGSNVTSYTKFATNADPHYSTTNLYLYFQTNGGSRHQGFTCAYGESNVLVFVGLNMAVTNGPTNIATTWGNVTYSTTAVVNPYVTARIALSDYVFSRDSNVTATLRAGAIMQTNTSTASAASVAVAVTNLSTVQYPFVLGNWTWPGWQRWTNDTPQVRAVAFHYSAQQRKPVRSIHFVTTTTNGVMATNIQTEMKLDRSIGDAVPFGEYIGTPSIVAASNGARVRLDFVAYPIVGDTTLTTLDDVHLTNNCRTPFYCAQTNLCDRTGAYGVTYAVVDPAADNSIAFATNQFSLATPPNAFTNIIKAVEAIAGTNYVLYSRSNAGAGIIYLKEATHGWLDTHNLNSTPETWTIVTAYPGSAKVNVIVSNTAATQSAFGDAKGLCLARGITFNPGSSIFYDMPCVWFDDCIVNFSGAFMVRNECLFIGTRNSVTNFGQGWYPFASEPVKPGLLRGNWLWTNSSTYGYCIVGNYGKLDIQSNSGKKIPNAEGSVVYNNAFFQMATGPRYTMIDSANAWNNLKGAALIQNLFESTNIAQAMMLFCADSTVNNFTNALIWNNTIVGQRINLGYNDAGLVPVWRVLFQNWRNHWDGIATKTDTFGTANGDRIGNWSLIYRVGSDGVINPEITGQTDYQEFYGVNSYRAVTNAAFAKFTDRLSAYNSGSTNGWGNYRLRSESPHFRLSGQADKLPFDIEGVPRGASDPPGAYASGNVRKGAFF